MSDTLKFSSGSIKGWLEKETGSVFIPVQERAQKLVSDMRKALDSFAESSKMLLDNSGKEIEKRNMKTYGRARALNKLARLFLDRAKQIKIPEKITYDSFREFVQEIQQAFIVTEVDIRNYFPRISPFFILDRRKFLTVFEKAKELLKEMNNFLTKEYVKTKTLEETFQLINTLQTFETKLTSLKEEKNKTESEKASILNEITNVQQKIANLTSKGSIGQLNQAIAEIEALNTEVKHAMQHLQKPFIKLQSLSLHGEGSGLTPEELKKLDEYLENPFEALATEESGYSLLKQILQKLARLTTDGKIKLKPEKARKADQAINNIVNQNSLANLHQKCVEAAVRRAQLSNSAETAETKSDLMKLQELLENFERRKKSVESKENTIQVAQIETLEKIRNHKKQIERNIFSFLNRKISIE